MTECDAFAKKLNQDHMWAYARDKSVLEDWAHKGPWSREPLPGEQWRRCTNCGTQEEFTRPMSTITLAELDARIAGLRRDIDDLAPSLPNSRRTWESEIELLTLARTALAIKGGEEEAMQSAKDLRHRADFPEAHREALTRTAMLRAAELLERAYGGKE